MAKPDPKNPHSWFPLTTTEGNVDVSGENAASGPASDSDFASVSLSHLENFWISAGSKTKPGLGIKRGDSR